ncbi:MULTISPECIES: glycoside hydrolase family 31 protein [Pontibacillus]|uniref:Glycoside hydrolase family 31 protein n=1 Tax=Pontibacillus chungwhensis TaxID=265426 RepID=A0ABY8UXB9_9BACI|nr:MULTISPECIES: glycoside hydrolase family 31 protein [Pontibacillus]MCD5324300.1 glycoside hydrolase family 31 protein [Pontibacillus sp. HN14]WIF97647.1 glycoside hydrolase family 31 protein [Pontibacillus chungwhensis]
MYKPSKRLTRLLATTAMAATLFTAAAPNVLAVTQPHPDQELNQENVKKQLEVQSVKQLEDGVKLTLTDQKEAYIRLFAEDMAKVSILEAGEEEYFSEGIAKKEWDTPSFDFENEGNVVTLSTDEITIKIKKEPFGVKFLDKEGNVINEDYMQNGAGYDGDKPYVYKKTNEDEAFYGFGEQAGLNVNQRGESIGMFNTDAYAYQPDTKYLYTSIPFFMGLKNEKAYGIFFDNANRSYFEMASESDDYYYFYADDGKLTYYFMYGPEIQDVLDRYTELTGKMEKPAKWTLGLHQSKWGYTADEIESVAKTYRDKEIPLDTMHFDIDYMDEYRVYTWADDYASDELHNSLDDMNFHKIAINDPAVKKDPGYYMYDEGTANDYWAKNPDGTNFVGEVWPGDSVFPDFSKEEVRDWWADNSKVLYDQGIDGVWNDMNEPAVFDGPFHTAPLDVTFGEGDNERTHAQYHNLYGHDEAEATYEGAVQHNPEERPFVLTRDMYAGTQRYAALWTGDNVSEWDHLQMSIPMNANVGLSGQPFVGNDIGGFAGRPDAEMYARWIEVGAFLPFSRVHYDSDSKAAVKQGQEPWAFGQEVEDISKKYIEMRYKLMPYLYNTFVDASETGSPVQQPLVYQFQEDENTYDISDQFMFGEAMMLAPVVQEGQTERDVYLPEGETWVDYWTGKEYQGGQTVHTKAELDHLPIYMKKDSVIPTREVQQYTDEKPLENLVLDTYLSEEASYSFYEDDGATIDYKDGEFNITNFTMTRKGNHIEFTQEKEATGYDSELDSYTLKLNNEKAPKKVQAARSKYSEVSSVEEVKAEQETYFYDTETSTLYVNVPANEDKNVKIFASKGKRK